MNEEFFALVAESDAWAKTRYAKEGTYAAYLADLEQGWAWAESDAGWNIGRQIRCALIYTSLRSLSSELSPALLAQAVAAGLWSPAKALAHILQLPDEFARAAALTQIAPLLPADLQIEALQAARTISNEYARANVLSEIAPRLPPALQAEAWQAAHELTNETLRAMTLGGLALTTRLLDYPTTRLPDHSTTRPPFDFTPFDTAQGRQGKPDYPTTALSQALAEALHEPAPAEDLPGNATGILSKLDPRLPETLKEQAAQAEARKAQAMVEALEAVRLIADETARAEALIGIAPLLTDSFQAEAIQIARAIYNPGARARALGSLAPRLAADVQAQTFAEALQTARAITDEQSRAEALSDLIPYLPPKTQAETAGEAWQLARALTDPGDRARVFIKFVPHLPGDSKAETLTEALQTSRAIPNTRLRADALTRLAPHLPEALKTTALTEALQAAQIIADEHAQAQLLSRLAALSPDSLAPTTDLNNEQNEPKAWAATLRRLAQQPRAKFLLDLAELLPLVQRLGGVAALETTSRAIREVTRWWP